MPICNKILLARQPLEVARLPSRKSDGRVSHNVGVVAACGV